MVENRINLYTASEGRGHGAQGRSSADETAGTPLSMPEAVTRLADTIHACDRLCLLTARTVIRAGRLLDEPNGPLTFIPNITRDLTSPGDNYESYHGDLPRFLKVLRESPRNGRSAGWYPTTSAACIAALQALTPVVRRFRLGTRESKDLTFHPIEHDALEAFDPKKVPEEAQAAVVGGLKAFNQRELFRVFKAVRAKTPGSDPGGDLSDNELVETCLFSTTFGALHPFNAAQTLRAIAPTNELFQPVWRTSLFTVLWFLNRRGSSLRGHPNIQATASPGTAVMTSKCVDAVESVYNVFVRRWDRIQRLIGLFENLRKTQASRNKIKDSKSLTNDKFDKGYHYREDMLIRDLRVVIGDIAKDTGVEGFYSKWNERVALIQDAGEAFTKALVVSFAKTVKEKPAPEIPIADLEAICGAVKNVHDLISGTLAGALPNPWPPKEIPPWVCSRNFWTATKTVIAQPVDASPSQHEAIERTKLNLEVHWHRHFDASHAAYKMMQQVVEYFNTTFKEFKAVTETTSPDDFLSVLKTASKHIAALHGQLWKAIEGGVRWTEILMNRHLGYEAGGTVALFDPNELAHAVRVVCRAGNRVQFNTLLAALRRVCAAQREDGTWPCQQPFHWSDSGHAMPTLSIETAMAMVASVNAIVRNPEGFGASREEVSSGIQPVYEALDRFFRWLSGSVQSLPVPLALIDRDLKDDARREPPLYGWCSDRVFEPGTIHSWVTASAIEFLINYRQLLQQQINARLRSEFVSHHPAELSPCLSDVAPTDLRNFGVSGKQVVAGQLMEHLRSHKALELAEGPWLPIPPKPTKISFYSAVLYGPPGSSKTVMAKAIAGELQWPLISLSPADFLADGEQRIEAQAEGIFTALSAGSRMVYFFDEIDELLRHRNQLSAAERSVFTFLTPSFLTKLQGLRDTAKHNEFIFILGTNYVDHIDSAAKRSGRIDEQLPIVYPDEPSRAYIILNKLVEKLGFDALETELANLNRKTTDLGGHFLDAIVEFSGFLSYPNLLEIIDELLELINNPSNKERLDRLQTWLRELNADLPGARFRPEVRLTEYCERPETEAEVRMIVESLPARSFPPSKKPSRRENELNSLLKQIKLRNKDGDLKGQLTEFQAKVANILASTKKRSGG
jgi:hypothetical protein